MWGELSMKRKVSEIHCGNCTQNHHHLGQFEFYNNEGPDNFSNSFWVCVSSAKAPRHYGELKDNWMKISLKHKMMHTFKSFSPSLHYISYYTKIEWQAGRKLLGMHNHVNKWWEWPLLTIFDHDNLRKGPLEVI